MKRSLLLIMCLCFFQALWSNPFAYVYRDSILAALPGYGQSIQRIDSLKQVYESELDQTQKQLQQKFSALLSGYSPISNEPLESIRQRMSTVDSLSLNLLLDEDKALQMKSKSYENIVRFVFERDVQPVLDRVNNTIAEYAVQQKIGMVYILEEINQSLAYIDRRRNITQIIIYRLKE